MNRFVVLGIILGVIVGDIAYKVHLYESLTTGEKAILDNLHFLKLPGLKGSHLLDDPILITAGIALIVYFIYFSK